MVLIAIAIIGILAAIAVPGMKEVDGVRLSGAALRLSSDLKYAQDLAMRTGLVHTVVFSGTAYRLTVEGGTIVEDPSFRGRPFVVDLAREFPGVKILSSFPGNELAFDARGIPDRGGSVTLTLGRQATVLVVEEGTGRISSL